MPLSNQNPGIPAGGGTGQSLVKRTNNDFDVIWSTITGGGGGGVAVDTTNADYQPIGSANTAGAITASAAGPAHTHLGVHSITAGSGLTNAGTATDPVLNVTGLSLVLDTTVGDYTAVAAATAAGSVGKAADSGHAHQGVFSVTAGTAISLGGTANAPIVNNTGVTSIVAGSGISISGGTGAVTITNTGAGGVTIDGTLGDYTAVSSATAVGATGKAADAGHAHLGVHSVSAGTNISNSGTATDPVINVTGVAIIDSTLGDYTAVASATAVGATGKAADAGHAHLGVKQITTGTGISNTGTANAPILTNTGIVALAAGTGIALSGSGTVTISATSSGGLAVDTTVGDYKSVGPAAVAPTITTSVAGPDHIHAHGSGYLPNAHHNQVHSDADHSGANSVSVQLSGTLQGTQPILNFVHAGLTVSTNTSTGVITLTW